MPGRIVAHSLLLLALAAGPALAQSATTASPTVKQACMSDYKRLCSGVKPGRGGAIACMEDHRADLSRGCKMAVASAAMEKKKQHPQP